MANPKSVELGMQNLLQRGGERIHENNNTIYHTATFWAVIDADLVKVSSKYTCTVVRYLSTQQLHQCPLTEQTSQSSEPPVLLSLFPASSPVIYFPAAPFSSRSFHSDFWCSNTLPNISNMQNFRLVRGKDSTLNF